MMIDPANLSREFRTLVTSIRAPLEDELAERGALPAARRERLETLHHNITRLLRLVNTLFDMPQLTVEHLPVGDVASHGAVDLDAQTVIIPNLRTADLGDDLDRRPPRGRRAPGAGSHDADRTRHDLEAFSYSVSHELRGPLRAVDGFSQVLLHDYADVLDHDGQELIDQIHTGIGRMTAIVDDLLALSWVGKEKLRRDAVDLTAIARRIVADLRSREPSRRIEVRVADGMIANGDGRLVAIALENLLGNAWKFTGRRPDAHVTFQRERDGVFAILDNGAGFDMTDSVRLFEPFQRLHNPDEFEGTGLGLAIVRRVIERHGGRVWARGAVGGGAAIRFTLPGA